MAQDFDAILKAAEKADGSGPETAGEITVHVRPGSFVSDGRGGYTKGQVVRAIAVGRISLPHYHVRAFLEALGVDVTKAPVANNLTRLLAYTPKSK